MKHLLLLLLALTVQPLPAASPIDRLESEIRRIIANKRAQVGVAVVRNGETLLTIGNDVHYPLMSVMKFHQALAVADHMRRTGATLGAPVRIEPKDLKPNTYSPLRDRYGRRSLYLPIDSLLDYSLRLSDNNACDLLFACVGGPEAVDRHIRTVGGRHFAIAVTEEEMHRDPSCCRDNWSTPLDAARLMDDFIASCHRDSLARFIRKSLLACETGTRRLPRMLPPGVRVGHKTGTSDCDDRGFYAGVNDLGFFLLADGSHYVVAVFITESAEQLETNERIIAEISEQIYRTIASQKHGTGTR